MSTCQTNSTIYNPRAPNFSNVVNNKPYFHHSCPSRYFSDGSDDSDCPLKNNINKTGISHTSNNSLINSESNWSDEAASSVIESSRNYAETSYSSNPNQKTSDRNILESETASNDGSEVSMLSLGTRIQRVATRQRPTKNCQNSSESTCNSDIFTLTEYNKEILNLGNNDSQDNSFAFRNNDWKILLNENNDLLQKLMKTNSIFLLNSPGNRDQDIPRMDIETRPILNFAQENSFPATNVVNSEFCRSPTTDDTDGSESHFSSDLSQELSDVVRKTPNIDASISSYFQPSDKPIRPLTPSTPDCVLEDINEETSELESDSCTSGYKSAFDNKVDQSENSLNMTKTQENVSSKLDDESCLMNFAIIQKTGDFNDNGKIPIVSENVRETTTKSTQNAYTNIMDVPSRNDFINQKNALTRLIIQNSQKRQIKKIERPESSESSNESSCQSRQSQNESSCNCSNEERREKPKIFENEQYEELQQPVEVVQARPSFTERLHSLYVLTQDVAMYWTSEAKLGVFMDYDSIFFSIYSIIF